MSDIYVYEPNLFKGKIVSENTYLSTEQISKWISGENEHQFDFENDARLILSNNDSEDVLFSLSMYVNYLAEKSGQHEDFVRDACNPLVSEDSPYRDFFISAYKASHDPSMSDKDAIEEMSYDGVTHDDLIYYFASKSIDNQTRLNFMFSFLVCLSGYSDCAPPSDVNLELLRDEMISAFENIAMD